jgi:hypothetical protein
MRGIAVKKINPHKNGSLHVAVPVDVLDRLEALRARLRQEAVREGYPLGPSSLGAVTTAILREYLDAHSV